MDKNTVECRLEDREVTVYGKKTSEVIVDVVRDAIDSQKKALEVAIMRRDSDGAHHIVETLIVLEKLLEDIGEVCDKFGWYY